MARVWYGFGTVLVRVALFTFSVFYTVFDFCGTGCGTGLVRVWYGFGTGQICYVIEKSIVFSIRIITYSY